MGKVQNCLIKQAKRSYGFKKGIILLDKLGE
jgi:hypothetical protein